MTARSRVAAGYILAICGVLMVILVGLFVPGAVRTSCNHPDCFSDPNPAKLVLLIAGVVLSVVGLSVGVFQSYLSSRE